MINIVFFLFLSLVNCTFTCIDQADCNYKGICNSNKTSCICDEGWTTYHQQSSNNIECNYKQKKQKTAFFMSFFLGFFAAGQLYVRRLLLAFPKMCLTFLSCISHKYFNKIICFLITIIVCIWWLIDVILFGKNMIPDKNDIPLFPW